MYKQLAMKCWIQTALWCLLPAAHLQAFIISINPGEINIPISSTGVYLDVETGENSTTESSLPNWDLNFFFGGEGIGSSMTFHPVQSGTETVLNLDYNSVVNEATNFYGSAFSGSEGHIGMGADQFTSGQAGYIGFRFVPDTNPNNVEYLYGWMRVTLDYSGNIGTIHEWAYEDSGESILVGVVPEPAAYALLIGLIGATCVGMRRRGRS